MTRPHKKRQKGDWNVGKECKGDSSERQYAKKEIKEGLEDAPTYRHKGKRKHDLASRIKRLEHRIAKYQKHVDWYASRGHTISWLAEYLEKDKIKLAKLKAKGKI